VEPARSADAPHNARPVHASYARGDAAEPIVLSTAPPPEPSSADQAAPEAAAEPAPAANAAVLLARETARFDAPHGEELATFMGDTPDAPLRQALLHEEIKRVERGRGGRSLGFKITLTSGKRAYFKPEQTFSAANWFGEVAAYHLDRMLGLGRVPLVVSREFAWSELVEAAGKDQRKAELIMNDGKLRGAFVAWVTGDLMPLRQEPGWERWVRVRFWPSTAVTPFQRPAVWKRQLDLSRKMGDSWRTKEERFRRRNLRPEPDRADRPAELSDLIVFDYLTRNLDRWGGDNANVLVRGKKGPLVFLDNGAGFEPGEPRPSLMEARLHTLQRFRRSTIAAVRALDMERFKQRLAQEPVQPVLGNSQIEALAARRKGLLDWIAELEKIHGEAIWAWE
jgi:Golgi casein kinase, C-terminal, Fam20